MATILKDRIKTSLGILLSVTIYDEEITDLIDAAEADLLSAGVLKIEETDALIKRAVSCYCKANFRYIAKDVAEKFKLSYESLKMHLYSSIDYAYYKVTIQTEKQQKIIFNGKAEETDETGKTTFYTKPKNHIEYIVDGKTYYTDITNDITITV